MSEECCCNNGADISTSEADTEVRLISLYGDLEEETSGDIVSMLLVLSRLAPDPIEFLISTYGGVAEEMFAIYDAMRFVECPVHTIGMGKIMSGGVLLLAAGCKGQRRIGAHCRVMLHGPRLGTQGSLEDIQIDMKEVKWVQRQFIVNLAAHTNMNEKKLASIMRRKYDSFFSAQEAVSMGIADIII